MPVPALRRPPACQRGIAIGIILVAVALLAAISLTLTLAAKTGGLVSENNQQSLLATSIINQAAMLKTGLLVSQAKGGDYIESYHLNTQNNNYDSNGTGIYSPYDGAAEPQTPPSGSVTGSSTGWVWEGDNWNAAVQLPGMGSGYYYLLTLSYLQPGVCAQIDKQLTGSTTIPAITTSLDLQTLAVWMNASGASYSALNGHGEICFEDTRGVYQYYKIVQDDGT